MTLSYHLLNCQLITPVPYVDSLYVRHRASYKRRRFKRSLVSLKPLCFANPSFSIPDEALAIGLSAISSCLSVILSSRLLNRNRPANSEIGEWILSSSHTPFNQSVITRCPTVSLQARKHSDFPKAQNENCGVRINRGTISIGGKVDEDKITVEYQRLCILARDGGAISLDWPANLNLEEERDLDTTMLLVPSSTEGSMDAEVRAFVLLALKHGIFPIVMNPRGCAGSPLTTPRLFTAADSSDISTVVEFVNKARPWATMFGVGWGYGSNMITKYLAEVGDRTPLTAVTCFDSLFNMEAVTELEHSLVNEMKEILLLNKGLFQGRGKGFDLEKALIAKSVREFDEAISMVSYGFDSVEDFYSFCSSSQDVAHLKIPVIFIQSRDGRVPEDSAARNSIDENPFTSLLICSLELNSDALREEFSFWCHQLSVEWLKAVEFSIWKGAFPLLPVSEYDSRNYDVRRRLIRHTKLSSKWLTPDSRRDIVLEEHLKKEDASDIFKSPTTAAEILEEGQETVVDSDKGNVQKTAEVVMNMLDVTMPDVLNEEMKEKVMEAVTRGENLVNALQDAVPEDAREKLARSVSVLLQTPIETIENDIKTRVDVGVERLKSIDLNMGSSSDKLKDGPGDRADHSKSELLQVEEPKPVIRPPSSEDDPFDDSEKKEANGSSNPDSVEDTKEEESPSVETNVAQKGKKEEMIDPNNGGDVPSPQAGEKEDNATANQNQKIDGSNSTSRSFDVVQALDALSGIDDSTQVAVNSVFGVIEDIISKMEEKKEESDKEGRDINEESASTSDVNRLSKQPNETKETQAVSATESAQTAIDDNAEIKDDSISPHKNSSSLVPAYNYRFFQNLDATKELLLDYVPEDGQWRFLPKNSDFSDDIMRGNDERECSQKGGHVIQFARKVIIHSLTVASLRKMGVAEFTKMRFYLHEDIYNVAKETSFFMLHFSESRHDLDAVSRALAIAYWKTRYLKRILPVNVVVGSSIASLRKHMNAEAVLYHFPDDFFTQSDQEIIIKNDDKSLASKEDGDANTYDETKGVMVGAVTAAIGASALLIQKESDENSTNLLDVKGNEGEENQNNIVSSLAEKAMQVAAPVVPKTEAGEIDEQRLVAMLADLGKKGGALRLVGKVALLWGGIRGAMSLTDKLIVFLRILDRPLYQRVFGFFAMVLLLWSPIIIPFLPSLIQSWIDKTAVPFAEFVCIIGLYAAVMILVFIWGRRIHHHENPLKEYGLHLTTSRLLAGFAGGVAFVSLVQTANALLGFASFRFSPSLLPPFPSLQQMLNMIGSVIVSVCVILVEELLFRSWLPEEIAADLGHFRGLIIAALVFSVLQRDLWALPGLFLFSMVLSGLKRLFQGNLSVCVGLRSGVLASSFALFSFGFSFHASLPVWVTGSNQLLQPINNLVGIAFTAILVLLLKPYYNGKS